MYTYVILLAYMHMCLDGRDENRCVYVCVCVYFCVCVGRSPCCQRISRVRHELLQQTDTIQNKNHELFVGAQGRGRTDLRFLESCWVLTWRCWLLPHGNIFQGSRITHMISIDRDMRVNCLCFRQDLWALALE